MAEDRVLHEEQQVAFLASHRTAWEVDVVEKQRLAVLLGLEQRAQQVVARIGLAPLELGDEVLDEGQGALPTALLVVGTNRWLLLCEWKTVP